MLSETNLAKINDLTIVEGPDALILYLMGMQSQFDFTVTNDIDASCYTLAEGMD